MKSILGLQLVDDFEMQAVLWHTDTFKRKSTLEEHSLLITDVRFSPSQPKLATSSFDKTVRVWDADNAVRNRFSISLPVLITASAYYLNHLNIY